MLEFEQLRSKAIGDLNTAIIKFYGKSDRLNSYQLQCLKKQGYIHGWKIEISVAERIIPIALVVDSNYPLTPPHIFILEYKEFLLMIPHLDSNGVLCLGDTGFDYFKGIFSLKPLYMRAYRLLNEAFMGQRNQDFREEFSSYWRINSKGTAYSCIDRQTEDCENIRFCRIGQRYHFFEEEQQGQDWLKNGYGNKEIILGHTNFQQTLHIHIPDPWLPDEYPQIGSDILKVVSDKGTSFREMLLNCVPDDFSSLPILFSFGKLPDVIYACVEVHASDSIKNIISNVKKRNKKHTSSSRPVPVNDKEKFFLAQKNVIRLNIQRIDHSWLHYRAAGVGIKVNHTISKTRIAILGCGSLGSQVADSLCKADISQVHLFDPETLLWENLYRHLLGPDYIGENKAVALAKFLQRKFPAANITGYKTRWEDHVPVNRSVFGNEYDLVISLIGDTDDKSEMRLSYLTNFNKNFPPVIFGWTEVWGAAGHVVLLGEKATRGCLYCSKSGESQIKEAFHFERDQRMNLPACSQVFAPYGFIDSSPITAMISQFVLDFLTGDIDGSNYRIWLSNIEKMLSHDGILSEWMKNKAGNIVGEQIIRTKWEIKNECGDCHEYKIQRDP